MKKKFLAALLAVVCVFSATAAFAEGFGVYEWSAPGTAMGEAYMFAENDPAVIAYNPAQLTKMEGAYVSVNAAWIDPYMCAKEDSGKVFANSYAPSIVPTLYYAQKAGKNSWFGLGLFPRFGNNIEWPANGSQRYDTIFAGIKSYTIQPTYAFKANDKLSFGIGLDINWVNMKMTSKSPNQQANFNPAYDIFSKVEGDTTELGWVISAMYDFTPKTSASLVYRSRIEHTMDADADLSIAGMPYISTKAHGKVTLPDSVTFGIGHKFNDRTRVEFNAVWTNWKTYDALNMLIDGVGMKAARKDWKDSWRLGIGLEHKLNKKWTLLCGYVFDQSPVPNDTLDFALPTGDRHRGSIGFKYRLAENCEATFAYTAIWTGCRDIASAYPALTGTSGWHLHDGLTQALSLGITMKLK